MTANQITSISKNARRANVLPFWRKVGSVAALCGLLAVGCSRKHYRLQTDAVVSDTVAGATANPRYQLPGLNIAIDPRSRLYDPTNADNPPRPPDDPDSHRLMEVVDGHRGWPHWDDDGVLDDVEVNDYRSCLPYDADGRIKLDLRGTMELARLHSRDYQLQLESLYLSAVDVSAERFAFNAQFYGGNTSTYTGIGALFSGGPSSAASTTTNPFFTKMFTTGGTLVVGLANSIVWQFSPTRTTTNVSMLNFALSQPLLQYAGRPRILERLTLVERNLLENVRQYGRYRQGFYLAIATGNPNANFVGRIGGLGGGSGLSDFSGLGVGGFGTLGAITGLSNGGGANNAGISPGGLGGYLGFLQQQQYFRNIRVQNSRLRDMWLQLNAMFEAGRLENRFQVELARNAYYFGQSGLLQSLAAYDTQLDSFKVATLGLPSDIPFEVHDQFFEKFNLIDPGLNQLQEEVGDRHEVLSSAQVDGTVATTDQAIQNLSQRIRTFVKEVAGDMKAVEAEIPTRRKTLTELTEFHELKDNQFDNRALTPEALDLQIKNLRKEFPRVSSELTTLAEKFDELAAETDLDQEELIRAEKELLTRLSSSLLELSLLQARARLHGISLAPVRLTSETALQVALAQRPDWMNAKASLVDTWRLIRYNANALRTNVTVNISGNLGTSGNNPIQFNGENGQLSAGLTIDPPLTRVLERNNFRIALVQYQQARRQLMAQRDQILQEIRLRLRQIRLDTLNLELRRLAVDVAITQTDVARLKLVEPEKPSTDSNKITTVSPTVARDLSDALANLVNSQQALIFTWGDYESQRRLLDYALGTMRVDDSGMWIDPGPMTDETILSRYYDNCPDPLQHDSSHGRSDFFELAPGELPPEPAEMDIPVSVDPPSPE